MPLVIPAIQKEMEAAITAALTEQFAKEGSADPSSHKRTAAAIAQGVTQVLVKAILTTAVIGTPVGPGTIT